MKLSQCKMLNTCIALLLVVAFVSACGATPEPINKEELRQRANEELSKTQIK